ncbi:hypothetical protein EHP00_582 [Ecytonucleospora hepatopenaei]|uniref:Rhodanese domain-containing protein n=1 Tax=Ecytonucleospora hepatopenaei TaxID=646526 RepID=A0A1W0E8F9_9MICR|nr:hypothetical protein EHP00_582 [Ecytonucleospora hepatopenaei]
MDFNRIFEENTTNESLEHNSEISILEKKPYSNTFNTNNINNITNNITNNTTNNITNNTTNNNIFNNIDYIKNNKSNKYEKINFSGLSICDGNILNDRNIKHNNIFTNINNHSSNLKVKEITLTQLNQLLTDSINDSITNSINDILIFDCRPLNEYKENKNIINDILKNNECNSNIINNKYNSNIIINNYNNNIIWFKNIHDNITLLKNTKHNHIIFYTNDNKRSLEIKEIIINLQKGFRYDNIKKYYLLEIL